MFVNTTGWKLQGAGEMKELGSVKQFTLKSLQELNDVSIPLYHKSWFWGSSIGIILIIILVLLFIVIYVKRVILKRKEEAKEVAPSEGDYMEMKPLRFIPSRPTPKERRRGEEPVPPPPPPKSKGETGPTGAASMAEKELKSKFKFNDTLGKIF